MLLCICFDNNWASVSEPHTFDFNMVFSLLLLCVYILYIVTRPLKNCDQYFIYTPRTHLGQAPWPANGTVGRQRSKCVLPVVIDWHLKFRRRGRPGYCHTPPDANRQKPPQSGRVLGAAVHISSSVAHSLCSSGSTTCVAG